MLATALVLAVQAADVHPLVNPRAEAWARAPLAEADRLLVHPWAVQVVHPSPPPSSERDRLYVQYSKWLTSQGYIPVHRDHKAPWQRVRWQRFENEEGALDLEVRRNRKLDAWSVWVVPRGNAAKKYAPYVPPPE
jgi:hypothetical protein